LAHVGQVDAAIVEFEKVLESRPDFVAARKTVAVLLATRGKKDAAIAHYEKVLQTEPDSAETLCNLGNLLADRGQFDAAILHYRKALEIEPGLAEVHYNLANALTNGRGDLDAAIAEYEKALKAKPNSAEAQRNLDIVESLREAIRKKLVKQRELLRSSPDDAALLNDTAWTLATSPIASLRNGREAVKLAQEAIKLSDSKEPAILGTLAAAYAEAGQFPEAVATAQRALTLATAQNKAALADTLRARIKLYQAGSPYRETPQPRQPAQP
jgi:protein O-mannosyl-transferase